MIVTIACDVLGQENNGTTIAAMNLIRSLKAKGHTVRVICPDKDRKGQEDWYVVPVFDFGIFANYVEKNGVVVARAQKDIVERAVEGANVVHIMTPFFLGHAAAKAARERNIPITAGFHCQAENFSNHIFMMNAKLVNKLVYRVFYMELYRYCTAIHYPTQFICDVFEGEVGKTNHYIISNGVGAQFKPAEGEKKKNERFTIVFTGRYSKEKSHKVLIDGVSRSKYRDNIQLIFAGAGPQEKNLREYAAKKLTVQPIFKFFSRTELIDVLQSADLYVHPAEIEIEAIACLEAIACGLTPVISDSPRSATRYFALDERNLFRCNDPDDLAKKIDRWFENPEERALCSERYAGYAKQFDFDTCMDRMELMLRDAAGKGALDGQDYILQQS